MIKGIFTAASGMLVNQERLNITANNLANVNTTGFKKDQAVQRSFKEMMISRIEGMERSVELGRIGTGTVLD
ncbi:MAG: flagellar basal-body rod protein FlgG, partial [Halanaerobiaceae bacterium]|nr:flagellar basal-body rod protein FlgG [Halanaerobiaceae bacterium]